MDEKYMKIKKLTIPTITMVIMMSQLLGCSAVSQSELLQMINNGDMIEIEVAVPINQEQGTEESILWEQLASLTTNPDLRKSWDNTLNITSSTDGKNGVLYVNTDGKNEPNNTLRVALHNREFVKFLESESTLSELAEAVDKNYVDIETEDAMESVYMGINGYFNLLPDSSPNYANPESTLQRNEFMAMIYRAETPVQDLKEDSAFTTAVGKSDYNIYAQGVADDSYLDLASKSLNNMTYNGTISRAEAIYTIVNRYFADDYKNVDIASASATFTDAKDGGNIAEEQKFIENATAKDYWKSYELTYALQNPDKGLPTDLYKALVVAQNRGLITPNTDTRWDEGITKSEALQLLVEALKQETGIPIFTNTSGTNVSEPTVDMNSTEVDSNAQDADVKISEEPETTEDTKSSSNPFSGMTYDELGAIDTTNFTDADWDNYITACQEAQAELDKNKPATEKQPWTGKPFEEMTQEELKAIDDETYYNLPKEDQDRWLKRYNETIVEKGAEFDQQNQNSGSTGTTVPTGEEQWELDIEPKTITPDGWVCY